jgi:hypothetical protein
MSKNSKIHQDEFKCKNCNKYYASKSSLCNHNKKFHNLCNTKIIPDKNVCNTKVIQSNIINSYNCNYCNKEFSLRQYRWKHEKICKNKIKLLEENNKLKIENKKLKMQIIPVNTQSNIISVNNTNSQINNGIINNINNNSLFISQLGSEKINYKAKDIRKIAHDGLNGAITCVQKTNFDKDKPENHSFLTSSLDGHYCTAINHETQKPEKVPKKDLFWRVLESSFKIIEGIVIQIECNNDLREQIPVNDQDKLYELIANKNKFYEKKNWKSFYNSINSMSYNYKDLILSTWNILKVPEIIKLVESNTDSEPDVKEITEFHDSDTDDDFNLLNII